MYYLIFNEISISTGLFGTRYRLYKDGFPFIDHTHKHRTIINEKKFSDLVNKISNVPKYIIDQGICFSTMMSWVDKPDSCIFETEDIEDIINLEQTHPEVFY